jgi:alpha-tubulin suppressor-like RCC1 family protein
MKGSHFLFVLGVCVHAIAALSCDISYEVLTYDRDDAGIDAPPPITPCDCGEQEICVAGSCVSLPSVSAIATGDRHTCRIYQGQLWCWGDNESDQLGLTDDMPDVVMAPERVGSRTDWFAVAAGSRHTCALRSPGVLRCWGDDSQGQLGNSSGRMRAQARVPWSDFTQLKCGGDNCCALRSGGALYCWGSNQDGNLGTGSAETGSVAMPTPVSGEQIFLRALSVGKSHSCAIATDRTLWCWGRNLEHQLGLPQPDNALVPTQVGEDHDWLWVATGGTQTCGVRKGNVLFCWGDNTQGQVGIERIGPDDEPVATSEPVIVTTANDWVRVAAGDSHTCAIKREQPLFCWGRGDQGQLGLSEVGVIESPARVHETLRFRELALGAAHSCGIDATSRLGLYCWGHNDRGQLGSGSTEPLVMPVKIDF